MEEQQTEPNLQTSNESHLEKMVKEERTQTSFTQQNAAPDAAVQSMEYAGFWVRFAANLVDGFVLIIPNIIAAAIYDKDLARFTSYAITWVYAIYMLSTRQATLGKMAVGIKVTTLEGGKPSAEKIALREIVGKILSFITLGIGYLMIVFTKKKRGLHDIIGGTVVIYDPTRKKRKWLVVLGVVFALIIPILGIVTSIVLVATKNARDKAIENRIKLEQKAKEAEEKLKQDEQNQGEATYCTQDAKQCSDGSYVGRVAPSCEFAPCPDQK